MGQGFQELTKQNLWKATFKNLKWSGLWYGFLKSVFHNFYLVHSWIPWLKCSCLSFLNSNSSSQTEFLFFALLFKFTNLPLIFLAILLLLSKRKSENEGYIWNHINSFWGQEVWSQKNKSMSLFEHLKSIATVHVSFKSRVI